MCPEMDSEYGSFMIYRVFEDESSVFPEDTHEDEDIKSYLMNDVML